MPARRFVAALDQGTTSTRCLVFDNTGDPVVSHQVEHSQFYPRPGWVEHDPLEIIECCKTCIDGAVAAFSDQGLDPALIEALGVTNQRETVVVWDRSTGQPLHNAVVWLDTRTHDTVAQLKKVTDEADIVQRTGLPIASYFSGLKLKWLIDNCPEVARSLADGSAIWGTIDTWIVWNLTKGVHVTDVTNAGRTMLMNISTCQWDPIMIEMLGVPKTSLPEIRSSSEVYGLLATGMTSLAGRPISGILGDQQSALVGQSCFQEGQAKVTYGTGGFLIVNTGTERVYSSHGLLTTPAYQLGPEQPVVYSLEGSIAIAGAAVTWLRDNLGIISRASEVESLASSVDDTGDVFFVPAFSGLFAPRWRDDARGTLVGITQFTTKAHIARAALLGIAFQVADVLKAVEQDLAKHVSALRCDGGASVNNLLMQMQADLTAAPVHRPVVVETTALGAAFAAGCAVGVFRDTQTFQEHWRLEREFISQISPDKRSQLFGKWESAIRKSLGWVEDACP